MPPQCKQSKLGRSDGISFGSLVCCLQVHNLPIHHFFYNKNTLGPNNAMLEVNLYPQAACIGKCDKMKDDAIAQLSDLALTGRMHEIERR